MDTDGNYDETCDSAEDEMADEEVGNVSESSDSEESDPEDSGFSNNDNGSQELTLLDDGPSVLILPSILGDEDEGEDGEYKPE